MTIGLLFVVVAIVGLAAALAWNFYPPIRDKLKGWTTIIEAVGGFVYYALGQVTGGIQEAVAAGYVPAWLLGWIPLIMLAWFIAKRFGTDTAVGQK